MQILSKIRNNKTFNLLNPFVSNTLFGADFLVWEGHRPPWSPPAVPVTVSATHQRSSCVALQPQPQPGFLQLQPLWSALKQLILFQGYLFSVNTFQRMQADGITCKAIVLVFQETQQHLESIQKIPTSRIKTELVYLTEIS